VINGGAACARKTGVGWFCCTFFGDEECARLFLFILVINFFWLFIFFFFLTIIIFICW
jgi:hypothetical protein